MADFQYDPIDGWNNETEFPDYPLASQVRGLFQKLFDQIRDAFNGHKNETQATATQPHGLSKNKLDATAAPTVNDDASAGYSVNSEWIDTTNGKAYKCMDATAGAAVWKETTASGGSGADTWEVIETRTLSSSSAQVDFTNVSGYKLLKIIANCKSSTTTAANLYIRINDNATTSYSVNETKATGATLTTAAVSATAFILTKLLQSSSLAYIATAEILITKLSSGVQVGFFSQYYTFDSAIEKYDSKGYFGSADPITKISIIPSANLIASGSQFMLMGVK
jgi:hypothetical protein